MTFREAAHRYGTCIATASTGDTILTLCDRIYESRDDIYLQSIMALNNRYDWNDIEPNAEIVYLSEPAIKNCYELTD